MSQKLSWSLFLSGLPTFLLSLGEFFTMHNSWSEMNTPVAIGHIVVMAASFVATICGALGAQLPRDPNSRDRAYDAAVTQKVPNATPTK